MSGKIRHLHEKRKITESDSVLARVIEVEEGEARSVELEGTSVTAEVIGHLCDVPLLQAGDRVLVNRTSAGVVILGRLRSPGERPRPRLEEDAEGRLLVEAAGGICLRVGEARLEIAADGKVHLDGREVSTFSSGRVIVKGVTIELG